MESIKDIKDFQDFKDFDIERFVDHLCDEKLAYEKHDYEERAGWNIPGIFLDWCALVAICPQVIDLFQKDDDFDICLAKFDDTNERTYTADVIRCLRIFATQYLDICRRDAVWFP